MSNSSLQLIAELESMDETEARQECDRIETLLDHESPDVRQAAAWTLGRAGLGIDALGNRLSREDDDLVATEICDVLAGLRAVRSLPQLRQAAEKPGSELFRSYAALALLDIQGAEAVSYLLERKAKEENRRVIATINVALFVAGFEEVLPDLLANLGSDDYAIRCRIANLLADYAPLRQRELIVRKLTAALKSEVTEAARSSLSRALSVLSAEDGAVA